MSDQEQTVPDATERLDAQAGDELIGANADVARPAPPAGEPGAADQPEPVHPDPEPLDPDSAADGEAPAASGDDLTPRERRRLRQEQIRRRKRERLVWIGMVAAGLLVLSAFLYFFWPVMAGRLDAVKKIDQAQALLERAKPTVNSIDKLVTAQLSPSAAPGVPDSAPQILIARRDLKQALALVDEAMPHLTEDEQRHAMDVRAATKARLDMLDHAPAILVASVKAVKAKTLVDRAAQEASAAAIAETAASKNYSLGTASAVESASVSLQRIKGQLADARQLYAQAAAAFPGGGLERFSAYIDARTQAVKLFSGAASAWLAGNRPTAAAQFAAYGRQLAKAAASIANQPSAPAAPGQAFRKVAGPAADAYNKAKKQASDADKALSAP